MKNMLSIALLLVVLSANAQTAKPIVSSKQCYMLQLSAEKNLKERIEKVAQNVLPDIQVEGADNVEKQNIKFYTAANIVEVRRFCLLLVEQKIPIVKRELKNCNGDELELF